MPLADFASIDVLWIALSAFLVVVGASARLRAYPPGRNSSERFFVGPRSGKEVLPLINKAGGTVDRVNLQLDKVDLVTGQRRRRCRQPRHAVRAVTIALTRPVKKISGLAAGLAHGLAAFARKDVRGAYESGRHRSRREQEIDDELERAARHDDGDQAQHPARAALPRRRAPRRRRPGRAPRRLLRAARGPCSSRWRASSRRAATCADSQVNVELEVADDALSMLVGPLDGRRLQADLDDDSEERIGLGRLLGTLVETASVEARDDGDWLRLEKRVHCCRRDRHDRA